MLRYLINGRVRVSIRVLLLHLQVMLSQVRYTIDSSIQSCLQFMMRIGVLARAQEAFFVSSHWLHSVRFLNAMTIAWQGILSHTLNQLALLLGTDVANYPWLNSHYLYFSQWDHHFSSEWAVIYYICITLDSLAWDPQTWLLLLHTSDSWNRWWKWWYLLAV